MSESLAAVILTGPSSAGKTSVAHALQDVLPDVWLHVPDDAFLDMVPMSHPRLQPKPMTALQSIGFFSGVVGAWKAMVDRGNLLLIDTVANELLLAECASAFHGDRVMVVSLTAPLGVLEARELERGDRDVGLARAQAAYITERLSSAHDLRIDTASYSVAEAARLIADAVATPPAELVLGRFLGPKT